MVCSAASWRSDGRQYYGRTPVEAGTRGAIAHQDTEKPQGARFSVAIDAGRTDLQCAQTRRRKSAKVGRLDVYVLIIGRGGEPERSQLSTRGLDGS